MERKASITALMSSFGRAFHAEHEEHPVFADHLARALMTGEEYDKFLLAAGVHGVDFQQDDLWYDLQGNAVKGQPRKGIYIRNGKKHVVR